MPEDKDDKDMNAERMRGKVKNFNLLLVKGAESFGFIPRSAFSCKRRLEAW